MIKKITLFGIISLLISSCESVDENIIIFDEVRADKEVRLSAEEDSPMCTVHLQLTYATDENGHKAEVINEIIQERLLDM